MNHLSVVFLCWIHTDRTDPGLQVSEPGFTWPGSPGRGSPYLGSPGHGSPGRVHQQQVTVRTRHTLHGGCSPCAPEQHLSFTGEKEFNILCWKWIFMLIGCRQTEMLQCFHVTDLLLLLKCFQCFWTLILFNHPTCDPTRELKLANKTPMLRDGHRQLLWQWKSSTTWCSPQDWDWYLLPDQYLQVQGGNDVLTHPADLSWAGDRILSRKLH